MVEEDWTFEVELVCEETKETKSKRLTLSSQPYTFLEIKKAIEKSFSIPVCVQSLLHQSNKVADSDSLQSSYVRAGDTFQVTYPIEGDCERVIEVVEWLKKLVDAFTQITEPTPQGYSFHLGGLGYLKYQMLTSGQYTETAKDLSLNLMFPWMDKSKYVNKLHFDSLAGARHLLSIYKCLVKARLKKVYLPRGHFLEMVCALFVANFTQTFPLRRRIIEYRGLDLCVNTFLMAPVVATEQATAYRASYDAIEVSLYAVCK